MLLIEGEKLKRCTYRHLKEAWCGFISPICTVGTCYIEKRNPEQGHSPTGAYIPSQVVLSILELLGVINRPEVYVQFGQQGKSGLEPYKNARLVHFHLQKPC